MDFIGEKVSHRKFGEGRVVAQDDSHISVLFERKDKPVVFLYPSCFEQYLCFTDPALDAMLDEILEEYEQEKMTKQEQRNNEVYAQIFTRQVKRRDHKNVSVGAFASEKDFYENYKRALMDEVAYLRANGGKRQRVFDGKLVQKEGIKYIYTFESESELNFPEGTQISIWESDNSIAGKIVECEGFTITISCDKNLGEEITSLEFSAEPWRLISALIARLDEMACRSNKVIHALICEGEQNIDSRSRIKVGQSNAVEMSISQPITFVWGPPGTGKTQTLAKIVLEHIARGNRVLMLSYSNVSVDGAIMRVHKLWNRPEPGILVRYGYAKRKDLLEHEYLTSYNLTILRHPELLKRRKKLMEERKKLSRTSSAYVEIGKILSQIKSRLAKEEKNLVQQARFVATTVSKAVVDGLISDGNFDVVIFDEASMAYIPQIIYSASLAKKHFICMGDFRQLPPIVQNDNESILNGDIFQYCGITDAVDSGKNHEWLCMLDEQYRMHPQIASFSSKTMYSGLLRSAKGMEQKTGEICQSAPAPGSAIGMMDLSGMMSVCTKTADNSRINVLSALLTFAMVLLATERYEAGIITPYHAQSRLLHAMSRDVAENNPELYPVSCATVHQFQGSEKEIILYDAVDCYRMSHPGMLLTSTVNNYANRLFNVALTRAKGKFVAVGNFDYLERKKFSKSLMFRRLMDEYRRSPNCLKGNDLMGCNRNIAKAGMSILDGYHAHIELCNDIKAARKEVRIDIPGTIKNTEFLHVLVEEIKEAKKKGVSIYIRAEKKNTLPPVLAVMAAENPFVSNPIILIDKKIIWYGMPDSDARFVSEGKTLPTSYYPLIRFTGKHTALSLYDFLEMGRTTDQSTDSIRNEKDELLTETFGSYVLAYRTCSVCGKPMKLQKSKKGKFFLACTSYPACQHTELVEVELVEKYFYRHGGYGQLCPRCGKSLEAKVGPYGLYIQCCGYARHKYKLDEI